MKYLKTIQQITEQNNTKAKFGKSKPTTINIDKYEKSETSDDLLELWSKFLIDTIKLLISKKIDNENSSENVMVCINNIVKILKLNNLNVTKIIEDNGGIFDTYPFKITRKNKIGIILTENDSKLENEIYKQYKKSPSEEDLLRVQDSITENFKNPLLEKYSDYIVQYMKQNDIDRSQTYNFLVSLNMITSINLKFIKFLEYDNIEDFINNNVGDYQNDSFGSNTIDVIKKKSKKIGSMLGLGSVVAQKFKNPKKSDDKFDSKIEKYIIELHPKLQDRFRYFFSEIESRGFKIVPTSGYRDFNKQAKLKKQNPKNATPGHSSHNYGIAIDFNIVDDSGKWYKKATPKHVWEKSGIPALSKELGFRWGGDFKSYYDPIHFDLAKEYSISQMRKKAIAESGQSGNNIEWNKVKGNKVDIA